MFYPLSFFTFIIIIVLYQHSFLTFYFIICLLIHLFIFFLFSLVKWKSKENWELPKKKNSYNIFRPHFHSKFKFWSFCLKKITFNVVFFTLLGSFFSGVDYFFFIFVKLSINQLYHLKKYSQIGFSSFFFSIHFFIFFLCSYLHDANFISTVMKFAFALNCSIIIKPHMLPCEMLQFPMQIISNWFLIFFDFFIPFYFSFGKFF